MEEYYWCRFLNDENYNGGFEQEETENVFLAMESNYEAWVNGFVPMAVGVDLPEVVAEYSRTLFKMRPEIAVFVSRMAFNGDLRGVLGHVQVPCSIIQTANDRAVPSSVAAYLKTHLGGGSTIHKLDVEGHLPHLSAAAVLAAELRRALP